MKNINLSHFFKPRTYLFFLATLIALAAGYYFVIALPAHDREKVELEKERLAAEQRQKQLQERSAAELQERLRQAEQERLADEQVKREKERLKGLADEYAERERERQAREDRLEAEQERIRRQLDFEHKQRKWHLDCMQEAERRYWEHVKLNGGKEVDPVYKPGVYTAPVLVWEEARKVRQAALDECDRLHRLLKE